MCTVLRRGKEYIVLWQYREYTITSSSIVITSGYAFQPPNSLKPMLLCEMHTDPFIQLTINHRLNSAITGCPEFGCQTWALNTISHPGRQEGWDMSKPLTQGEPVLWVQWLHWTAEHLTNCQGISLNCIPNVAHRWEEKPKAVEIVRETMNLIQDHVQKQLFISCSSQSSLWMELLSCSQCRVLGCKFYHSPSSLIPSGAILAQEMLFLVKLWLQSLQSQQGRY